MSNYIDKVIDNKFNPMSPIENGKEEVTAEYEDEVDTDGKITATSSKK